MAKVSYDREGSFCPGMRDGACCQADRLGYGWSTNYLLCREILYMKAAGWAGRAGKSPHSSEAATSRSDSPGHHHQGDDQASDLDPPDLMRALEAAHSATGVCMLSSLSKI